jgi:hypothetical protein
MFFLIIFVILTVNIANSQTYESKTETENVLSEKRLDPFLLSSFGISTASNVRNTEITGNSVFLSQIGEFNEANISTNTKSSEINITQNGDYNSTDLRYIANTAVSDLVQNGNFNTIKDYVNDPNIDISLDLKQDGDYLNFQREGVNELTKSLRFIQTEASPSLIIRSYK